MSRTKNTNTKKRKAKTLVAGIKARQYTPDFALSIPRRAAHFFQWASENYPHVFCPYNHALRAVMGYGYTPRLDSEEVERFRQRLGSVGKYLQETPYATELLRRPGSGARACVDDEDILKHCVPKRMGRLRSTKAALAQTVGLINPARIPNNKDNKAWKLWLTGPVNSVLRTVNSKAFDKKCSPPPMLTEASEEDE